MKNLDNLPNQGQKKKTDISTFFLEFTQPLSNRNVCVNHQFDRDCQNLKSYALASYLRG